jgi:hypothetical protein
MVAVWCCEGPGNGNVAESGVALYLCADVLL